MLPLHLALWQIDATARAVVQESVQAAVAPLGSATLLTGAELSGDARAEGARALYTVEGRGRFDRALALGAAVPAESAVSADLSGSATFTTSPRSSLAVTSLASLATAWGQRADSLLLALDPFAEGRRLEYAGGLDVAYALTPTTRSELGVDAGASQAGAFSADSPAAVGLDSRELHGGVSYGLDVGPRLSLGPELRASTTRFTHALLDVDRRRGPAVVHTVSWALGASFKATPALVVTGSGGLTLGSPMPIAGAGAVVVAAPEAGLGVRWRGRRARLTARYAWSYSALGPRIGFGQQHTATLRLSAAPFASAGLRESLLRVTVRAAHGAAPIGADPPLLVPGQPPPPLVGTLVATTLAGRATLEVPFARGWAVLAGIDLLAARGRLDAGDVRTSLTAQLTLGLGATVSTDRTRLFPRAPGAGDDEATRRERVEAGRAEDRTLMDPSRADDAR